MLTFEEIKDKINLIDSRISTSLHMHLLLSDASIFSLTMYGPNSNQTISVSDGFLLTELATSIHNVSSVFLSNFDADTEKLKRQLEGK